MKYVLCETENYFDRELDQTMYKVSKPLQIFESEEAAHEALYLFNSFYDYELSVIAADRLHEEFR